MAWMFLSLLAFVYVPIEGTAWSKLLINCTDPSIMSLPPYLKSLLNCPEEKLFMTLRYLKNKNTTCNDGSPAGFYIRRQRGSKKWLVFLEGGWYCHSEKNCQERLNLSKAYSVMSSLKWPKRSIGDGILSPSRDANPNWWNVNHVYLPYCSSDVWTGNASRTDTGGKFSFLGAIILEEVIKELLSEGLFEAELLLLAGSSAGGTGVLLNLDRIGDKLEHIGSTVKVRGLADSGWFLNTPLKNKKKCDPTNDFCKSPKDIIKAGVKYWRSVIPTGCATSKSFDKRYLCYFGNEVYPTIKRPVFVFQWLYDTAQIIGDNRKLSLLPHHLAGFNYNEMGNYVMQLGKRLRKSLASSKVSAVFAPSCIAHTILTQKDWREVKVRGARIDDAIQSWLNHEDDSNRGWRKRGLDFGPTKEGRTFSGRLETIWRKKTTLNLTDTCLYPTCNAQCPTPKNPITGDTLDMTQLAGMNLKPGAAELIGGDNTKDVSGQKLKLIDRFYSDFNG